MIVYIQLSIESATVILYVALPLTAAYILHVVLVHDYQESSFDLSHRSKIVRIMKILTNKPHIYSSWLSSGMVQFGPPWSGTRGT